MRDRFLFLLVGLAIGALAVMAQPNLQPDPMPLPRAVSPNGSLAPDESTIITLFENARGSVVAITTAAQVFDPWSRQSVEVPRGTGSGFVWDDRGHVVTNNHVIQGASGAQVQLADGRTLPARLVGTAPAHDLAVLRVDTGAEPPPPIPIGSSAGLRVGQSVLAIGNPFGLDWTLTTGVVSALDRQIPEPGGRTIGGLIQTDAAINPGNSGGPLIDSSGRLIGVNTAIYSPSGSSAGIGFAVPVDTVNRVVPQLIATGRYRPPYLGLIEDERVNTLARRQGIRGVIVLGVEPGSPAEAAGLRPARRGAAGQIVAGDIITGMGSTSVETSDDLLGAIELQEPGTQVVLRVRRDSREVEVPVTLTAPR